MRLLTIIIILNLSFIYSNAQQDTLHSFTEMYTFESPIPRFDEKELINEIKQLYEDHSFKGNVHVKILINQFGEIINVIVINDSINSARLQQIIYKYNDWIAGLKNNHLAATDYNYEISRKKGKVYVKPYFIPKQKSYKRKYQVEYFLLYKGIKQKSKETISQFNGYFFINYLTDSLNLLIIPSYRYRAKYKERELKISISENIIKSGEIVLIFNHTTNELIEFKTDQNYIFLPSQSTIDFLSIKCKEGLMIMDSFVLVSDIEIESMWIQATYDKIANMIENW